LIWGSDTPVIVVSARTFSFGITITAVHLRRALLLFAIVLGMAALAASLSRPVERRGEHRTSTTASQPGPPTAAPKPASELAPPLSLEAGRRKAVRMRAGEAATLEVAVDQAGTVDIPELGLSAAADAVTPARFDLFAARPGTYRLRFTPAAGDEPEHAGRLVVTSRG
jgi:hypothetical protein